MLTRLMKSGLIGIGLMLIILSLCHQAQAQTEQAAPDSLTAALAIEDPAERIESLQKFLKANNGSEHALTARQAIVASWAQIAEVQLSQNNIEKAVVDFRKALAALPETITDRFFEETVVRIPEAVSARGYRNEAIELARQIEKRFAKEPARLAAIGEYYLTVEAPDDSIRALEAAVKLAGDEGRIHRSLGAAYRIGLRLDDAISEYQQAVRLEPGDQRAYYELANLYRAYGVYADAIKLYGKQIEIEPKHIPSYKGMALAHLAQGDEDRAMATLKEARDLRGAAEEITQDIYLKTQMSFYYLAQKKFKEARQAAETALAIEPRYAWARIAAAEVDLLEEKYFDAERNLIAAQRYASFPTLLFTLGKLYLAVEDFDGALEQFTKAFSYLPQKQFTARLGGAFEAQADNLPELFLREYQAAIFLAEPPTTGEQYKIVESLVRFNTRFGAIEPVPPSRAGSAKPASNPRQLEELEQSATDFIEAERTRRPFRALYIAQRLAQVGIATETAVELAERAFSLADIATELNGSLREYPNYDRQGRLRVFRGRALDVKGWALFKSGKTAESIAVLSESVQTYGELPEGKRALWHLATVKESAGEIREALDLYIAGYEPRSSAQNLDVNRAVLEGLYRQVNGSLDGLDERLRRAQDSSGTGVNTLLAGSQNRDNTGRREAAPISSGEKTEPQIERPDNKMAGGPAGLLAEKKSDIKEPQFQFSIPPPPFGKDRISSSKRLPQTANSSTGKSIDKPTTEITARSTTTQSPLPSADPMFATRSTDIKPVEKQATETLETAERSDRAGDLKLAAAEVNLPVVKDLVELPPLQPDYDAAANLMPIIKDRMLFIPVEIITIRVDQQAAPEPVSAQRPRRVHTRKRRVTVQDNSPRNR
jgi:tetratricopeptide (TPR) repeat protein